MFEKLIELLSHFWTALLPCEVLDAYEAGVVLRFGVYSRSVGPGLVWKWPLVERVLNAKTCTTTMRLPAQIITTRDGKTVVIEAMVKYRIRDVRPFLLDIWDSVDVLADVSMGAIKRAVNSSTYAQLQDPAINSEAQVIEIVRKECNRYGFEIQRITFTDLALTKALRLLGDSVASHVGGGAAH